MRLKHRAFAQELDEVVVRLQQRRPDATGEERLGLVDDAEQQRRQRQDEQRTWTTMWMASVTVISRAGARRGSTRM